MDFSWGIIFGLIAMIGWGTADVFLSRISKKSTPEQMTLWTQLIGLALHFPLLFFFPLTKLTMSLFLFACLTSFFSFAGFVAFSAGLKAGNASIIAPIANAYGFVVTVLSVIFLRETLGIIHWIAIIAITIGTILTSMNIGRVGEFSMKRMAKGAPYAFLALISWGIGFFLIILLVRQIGWFTLSFLQSILVLVYVIIYIQLQRKTIVFPRESTGKYIVASGLLVLAFIAYNIGTQTFAGSLIAPIGSASPVVTVLLALLFLKERPTSVQYIGIAAVLIGLITLSL